MVLTAMSWGGPLVGTQVNVKRKAYYLHSLEKRLSTVREVHIVILLAEKQTRNSQWRIRTA